MRSEARQAAGSTRHRLDPLLRPRSVAIVGASARADSLGEWSLTNLLRGGFAGNIYPVNPHYTELQGLRSFARLRDLPEVPDLVIFGLADSRIEQALDEAIAVGVPAAVLMSPLVQDDDRPPLLKERVRKQTADAGMLVCGANGMGFYNVRDGVWACGFDSRRHLPPGKVSLISHSGSGMSGIIDCDERVRINFAVSTGNEIGVTMDDYLDFVLDLPETRVVGLFIETARNPAGLRAALAKAADLEVPVVALKVGRSEKSAELALSHSGAMAGRDATYQALFERYGVQRVRDMDELATALILFAEAPPPGPGGLVTLHDSGGERQLIVDLADQARVPLTELGAGTVAALEQVLDPELPAVNPLDAWSRGGERAAAIMSESFSLMMQDPGAALGAVMHDRAPGGIVYASYLEYLQRAHADSGKPVVLVAARQGTGSDARVVEATQAGFPVLDGIPAFLAGVRALFGYRDFRERGAASPPPAIPTAALLRWRAELAAGAVLDEAAALELLRDCGIAANPCQVVESEAELAALLPVVTFPAVLKTAQPGLLHKTDRQGVVTGLQDEAALRSAYRELAARLGPRALVAPMIQRGTEMLLGARQDPQFGPVVLLGFGGIHAEILEDVVTALPPFDSATARRRMDALRMRRLLDGRRGNPPADVDAFCDFAARFSALVDELRDDFQEIDINPVIVTAEECVAVDALVIGRRSTEQRIEP